MIIQSPHSQAFHFIPCIRGQNGRCLAMDLDSWPSSRASEAKIHNELDKLIEGLHPVHPRPK